MVLQLLDDLKERFTDLQNIIKTPTMTLNWWIEIVTTHPTCTYYFGPFDSQLEAKTTAPGFIEDLVGEGAQNIQMVIKRCHPQSLTVFEES